MKNTLFAALLLIMPLCLSAWGDDLETVVAECNDCHGLGGVSTDPDIPIIAGQSVFLLEDAMLAYADEVRPCRKSDYRHRDAGRPAITMRDMSRKLNEDDIPALAEHYSKLPFVAAEQEFDATLVECGAALHNRYCEECHSEGGSLPDDNAGILAGQWTPFLRNAIDQYLAGNRPMLDKMATRMEGLKPEDSDALLAFYASRGQ